MPKVNGLQVDGQEVHGAEDGFLRVRRIRLRTRRADGSLSDPFVADFVVRPKGPDAVVVALYHRRSDGVDVLLRQGLRPALALGRPAQELPIADLGPYLFFTEVVAGIIEREDVGEAGVRHRAALEIAEEAGYQVADEDVVFLGAGTFPTPGSMPEKYWLMAAEITDPDSGVPPEGDGSPMEEGATIRWAPLDEAIEDCVAGRIEDGKTELILRRLRDRLAQADAPGPDR